MPPSYLSDLLAFAPQPCSLFLISLMVISAFESVTILSLSGIILISERGWTGVQFMELHSMSQQNFMKGCILWQNSILHQRLSLTWGRIWLMWRGVKTKAKNLCSIPQKLNWVGQSFTYLMHGAHFVQALQNCAISHHVTSQALPRWED